jgi:hypothetical protein
MVGVMLTRTRCAVGIVVLTVLLAGTAGVHGLADEAERQVEQDLREVNSALDAVDDIEGAIFGYGSRNSVYGRIPQDRGATMSSALSVLDRASLTLEARTFRTPLRLAVDDYFHAPDGPEPYGTRLETLTRQLGDVLVARAVELRSDVVDARTYRNVATATAFLFSVLAVFLASRLMPYPRHRGLR